MIPYGRQNINQADIEAVVNVLKSDFLTQGPVIPQFEKAVANYCGVKYTYAVNSATSGLHIACIALGLQEGDIVWTSPISFVASANCAKYCGATVDFVDIDPITYNMSVNNLREKLLKADKEGKLPKIVIPVHLAGQSCDMEPIWKLSREYGFKIIEDASHAIGGSYKSSKVGSCEFSDITIFSFHPVKIITTGEGGMVCTNNVEVANKLYRLRSHGITRDSTEMTHQPDGQWYYQQIELGYNYRMTDLQAALGMSQLNRLDEFVVKRHGIYNRYKEIFKDVSIKLPELEPYAFASLHLYIVRIENNIAGSNRKGIFEKLRANGILANIHYIPIYSQPYYQQFGYNRNDFPESENYYKEAISLPIYPDLSDSELDYIKETIIRPLGHQTLF
ncbi:UDP-4-amino-4,6-dideoxy-N-acetyl-beta-L-altrosamine transaminase [Leptospira kanakyensis]|uniref:UDP-4-amino-4, 6-dideoxy-N-acetyl-beta-L-altrosamine transaminase n=1 Tax=Leptospira kanakyensis TaxID=2484968 RepID=UPI00223D9E31|nr:UDP-4-amino-4,6-dideoxy-N-acetyl-beta-L-altrosamine transaminase [Leptospira kanakyensis]MCW7482148.1 UDP-4-amino-4,6-dideoxy-N-acetyl-beta-L-altrosamine transaminase [Leptospira kanakyensis]